MPPATARDRRNFERPDMANTVLLNNIEHQNLRVIPGYSQAFGDGVNQTAVYPTEFAEAQRDYPILFRKDDQGKYQAVVILGLDRDENLFLTDQGWQARHVPAVHQRGPFLIGFQDQDVDGEVRREPVIYVDLDNPRVSQTDGLPLFLQHGGSAPYLQHVSRVLQALRAGVDMNEAMFAAFEAAGLIEPAELDIRLDEHTVYKVPGVYSINEDALAALEGEALEQLHKSGFLRHAIYAAGSLSNINRLIDLKNRKRAAEVQTATG